MSRPVPEGNREPETVAVPATFTGHDHTTHRFRRGAHVVDVEVWEVPVDDLPDELPPAFDTSPLAGGVVRVVRAWIR